MAGKWHVDGTGARRACVKCEHTRVSGRKKNGMRKKLCPVMK